MEYRLPSPVTDKASESYENSLVKVGCSSMQGWRRTMEDAHSILLKPRQDKPAHFFGIYDGHGTSLFSKDAAEKLFFEWIIKQNDYWNVNAFVQYDRSLKNDPQLKNIYGGTTAIVVLIRNGQVYCGNLGDSRAVACVKGTAFPLSSDHKPSIPDERERIRNAGGTLTATGRIMLKGYIGSLGLSRAFGDWSFKKASKPDDQQMVISKPEVCQHPLTDQWEFIVLGCDGIWECMNSEVVIQFVRERLQQEIEPQYICEELIMTCLATEPTAAFGFDNMTIIIICCLQDKSWKVYCAKVAGKTMTVPEGEAPSLSTTGADSDPVDDSGDADIIIETPGWTALSKEVTTEDLGGTGEGAVGGDPQVEAIRDPQQNVGAEARHAGTGGWSWFIPWPVKKGDGKKNN